MVVRDKRTEFVEGVLAHFQHLTPLLDVELAALLNSSWPHATKFLLVEYDSQAFSFEFAVDLWAMDADGSPLEGTAHRFLKGKEVTVPPAIYDEENYESEDEWEAISPWETASELLEQWFAERWSDHASKAPPAFIGHHDSYFKFDLSSNEETNWDRIIEKVKTTGPLPPDS